MLGNTTAATGKGFAITGCADRHGVTAAEAQEVDVRTRNRRKGAVSFDLAAYTAAPTNCASLSNCLISVSLIPSCYAASSLAL